MTWSKKYKSLFLLLLVASFILCACGNRHKMEKKAGAEMVFNDSVFDLGKVRANGGKVTHVFTFTNTGSSPLVIQKVVTSCHCSGANYTHKPIAPGEKGSVKVSLNPRELPKGVFMRTADVYSNALSSRKMLVINGEVE